MQDRLVGLAVRGVVELLARDVAGNLEGLRMVDHQGKVWILPDGEAFPEPCDGVVGPRGVPAMQASQALMDNVPVALLGRGSVFRRVRGNQRNTCSRSLVFRSTAARSVSPLRRYYPRSHDELARGQAQQICRMC